MVGVLYNWRKVDKITSAVDTTKVFLGIRGQAYLHLSSEVGVGCFTKPL